MSVRVRKRKQGGWEEGRMERKRGKEGGMPCAFRIASVTQEEEKSRRRRKERGRRGG